MSTNKENIEMNETYKNALESLLPKVEIPEDIKKVLDDSKTKLTGVINDKYEFKFEKPEDNQFESGSTENFSGFEFVSKNIMISDKSDPSNLYAGNIIFTYHSDTKIWSRSLFIACLTNKNIGNRVTNIQSIIL